MNRIATRVAHLGGGFLSRPFCILTLCILLLSHRPALAQSRRNVAEPPPPLNAPTLVRAINTFGLDAYRELSTQQPRSFTFSPPSLWLATGSLALGAQGETAQELRTALRLPSWEPIDIELPSLLAALGHNSQALAIATELFVQQRSAIRLLPGYLHHLNQSFKASAVPVDFAGPGAARTIDLFLENNGFLQPVAHTVVTAETRLLVANVVCAKAVWAPPFPRESTRLLTFRGSRGPTEIAFLHDTRYCGYASTDLGQMLEISGGQLRLVVLLPIEGVSITEVERQLDPAWLENSLARLRRNCETQVRLPRFTVETKADARQILPSLGAIRVFRGDADFSGMTGDRSLRLDNLTQFASLTVNEEGAEAKAATLGEVVSVSRSEPVVFQADRPFVFMLVHVADTSRPRLILFLGRYDGP